MKKMKKMRGKIERKEGGFESSDFKTDKTSKASDTSFSSMSSLTFNRDLRLLEC